MPWDPLDAWPNERGWIWATLALWLLVLRGPAFIDNLRAKPPQELVPDFFQEYASARNWLEGLPIYANQHEAALRYLGLQPDNRRSHVVVNAHPPTSVLLALPLARLRFADAFLAWNLVSLGGRIWGHPQSQLTTGQTTPTLVRLTIMALAGSPFDRAMASRADMEHLSMAHLRPPTISADCWTDDSDLGTFDHHGAGWVAVRPGHGIASRYGASEHGTAESRGGRGRG